MDLCRFPKKMSTTRPTHCSQEYQADLQWHFDRSIWKFPGVDWGEKVCFSRSHDGETNGTKGYIYLHENHKHQPNVGKYIIHGSVMGSWESFLWVECVFFLIEARKVYIMKGIILGRCLKLWLINLPQPNVPASEGFIKGNQWLISP